MPTSASDGRGWVYDRIARTTAPVIIDAGAGEGTHSILARHLRLDARWVAVEIHHPYVERFMLEQKYDSVAVADVRVMAELLAAQGCPNGYVVLFGDVLEHLPREDAVRVLEYHLEHAAEIYVSVPIVYSPQGECFGNPHEEHLHHWHFEEMLDLLPGAESFRGVMVGRYWWRRPEAQLGLPFGEDAT